MMIDCMDMRCLISALDFFSFLAQLHQSLYSSDTADSASSMPRVLNKREREVVGGGMCHNEREEGVWGGAGGGASASTNARGDDARRGG